MSHRPLRFLVASALGSLVGACILAPAPAFAADRCEGTFCDLYYEHMAAPKAAAPAQQAAPATSAQATPRRPVPAANPNDSLLGRLFSGGGSQPATAGTAPAAPGKLVAVQGGGVVGLMNGTAPKRCEGTLCDLFYGGPPPEEPAAAPNGAAVAPEPASDETAPRQRRRVEEAPSEDETRSTCVADARDPWRCYRR